MRMTVLDGKMGLGLRAILVETVNSNMKRRG
jgi:hypothetical protein